MIVVEILFDILIAIKLRIIRKRIFLVRKILYCCCSEYKLYFRTFQGKINAWVKLLFLSLPFRGPLRAEVSRMTRECYTLYGYRDVLFLFLLDVRYFSRGHRGIRFYVDNL